jgi:hypothetical protein
MSTLTTLIDTIENNLPAHVFTGQEMKDVILNLMRSSLEIERNDHILTFIEGQSKPQASFQAWADKKFNTIKTKTDDSE